MPALKRRQECLKRRPIVGLDGSVADQAFAIEAIGLAGWIDSPVENLGKRPHAFRALNVHVVLSGAVSQVL